MRVLPTSGGHQMTVKTFIRQQGLIDARGG